MWACKETVMDEGYKQKVRVIESSMFDSCRRRGRKGRLEADVGCGLERQAKLAKFT